MADLKLRLIPRWYLAIWLIFVGLFATFAIVYHFKFSKDTSNTHLYKISDSLAFSMDAEGKTISVVKYKDTNWLCGWLCGGYMQQGRSVINQVAFQKDQWAYVEHPDSANPDIVNLTTGMVENVEVKLGDFDMDVDPATVPVYKDRGLTFSSEFRLTKEKISANHKLLAVYDDNCTRIALFNLGIIGALTALGPILMLWRARKRMKSS